MALSDFTNIAISKVLFDLGTLSKLQKNQYVDTTMEYLKIEDMSMVLAISRTLSGDSRDRTILRIRQLILVAYEYAERVLESRYLDIYSRAIDSSVGCLTPTTICPISETQFLEYTQRINLVAKIRDTIMGTSSGLNNLILTYEKDLDTIGALQEIIQDIQRKYNYLCRYISQYEELQSIYEKNIYECLEHGVSDIKPGFAKAPYTDHVCTYNQGPHSHQHSYSTLKCNICGHNNSGVYYPKAKLL